MEPWLIIQGFPEKKKKDNFTLFCTQEDCVP